MTRGTPEEQLCILLARFLMCALPPDADNAVWWSHIGHGGKRTKAQAGRFKAMGLRPGVADYIFLWSDARFARVAFLEAKAPKGTQSDEQKAFQQHCYNCGVDYAVVRTLEEAEDFLRRCGMPMQYRIDRNTGAWRRIT